MRCVDVKIFMLYNKDHTKTEAIVPKQRSIRNEFKSKISKSTWN